MVLCASCTWLKMTVENCGKLHVMFSFIYCISLVFWSAARGFNVVVNCNHWQEYYPGVFSDLGRFPMGIPLIGGGMKTTKMPVYVSIWVLWTDWRGWLVMSLTHSSRKIKSSKTEFVWWQLKMMTKTTTMAIVIIEMILIIIDASNFTNAFSFENTYMYFLMRFRPSSLLKYPKMLIKTFKMVSKVESLEDTRFWHMVGWENGVFWKRSWKKRQRFRKF